jgi:hypothetical protein
MSRLEVPLKVRRLKSTGDLVLHADLNLEVKTDRGTWENVAFRVDSGTEMTTMLASDAKIRKLPIPSRPVPGPSLHGQEVRQGLLLTRIVGMDATEYVFPCYFVGDPDGPRTLPRNLLGLTGVINQIRIIFDGATSLLAPYGVLVVEKR